MRDLIRRDQEQDASTDGTEIRPSVRLYRTGPHLIIYRIKPGWLDTLRIVHLRLNRAACLDE